MKILIVEDEPDIVQLIVDQLGAVGFVCDRADSTREALLALVKQRYDLMLLDRRLPDGDGVAAIAKFRALQPALRIVVVTASDGLQSKISGLNAGADDYLTKPFHKDELVARIHAIVRRSKGHAQSVIITGDLTVNLDQKTVEVDGQRVHLTGKEYQMLELLSLRKGTTPTKEMFLNHLYGGMDEPELKIIDVFICKLRKKLANASSGKNYIETVWGRGYVLREPSEDEAKISA